MKKFDTNDLFVAIAQSYRAPGPRSWSGLATVSMMVEQGWANPVTNSYLSDAYDPASRPAIGKILNAAEAEDTAWGLRLYAAQIAPGARLFAGTKQEFGFATADELKTRINEAMLATGYLKPFTRAWAALQTPYRPANPLAIAGNCIEEAAAYLKDHRPLQSLLPPPENIARTVCLAEPSPEAERRTQIVRGLAAATLKMAFG